jgi:hypothetical protein
MRQWLSLSSTGLVQLTTADTQGAQQSTCVCSQPVNLAAHSATLWGRCGNTSAQVLCTAWSWGPGCTLCLLRTPTAQTHPWKGLLAALPHAYACLGWFWSHASQPQQRAQQEAHTTTQSPAWPSRSMVPFDCQVVFKETSQPSPPIPQLWSSLSWCAAQGCYEKPRRPVLMVTCRLAMVLCARVQHRRSM